MLVAALFMKYVRTFTFTGSLLDSLDHITSIKIHDLTHYDDFGKFIVVIVNIFRIRIRDTLRCTV